MTHCAASVEVFLKALDNRAITIRLDKPGERDKCGAIPEDLTPILDRLGVDRSNWMQTVREIGRMFTQATGRASSLVNAARR